MKKLGISLIAIVAMAACTAPETGTERYDSEVTESEQRPTEDRAKAADEFTKSTTDEDGEAEREGVPKNRMNDRRGSDENPMGDSLR